MATGVARSGRRGSHRPGVGHWRGGHWRRQFAAVVAGGALMAALTGWAVTLGSAVTPGLAGEGYPRATAGLVAAEPVSYQWPLPGPPPVARPFDPPAAPWLPGHRGVDLEVEAGVLVRAAGAGVVHFAGPVAGRGVVSIAHPDGLRTTYEPVEATVTTGDLVNAGEPIGVLEPGHAGCPAATCLHWGLRRGETYLDPLSLLGQGRVRLLPLPSPPGPAGPGR